jgi:hypothetical protein
MKEIGGAASMEDDGVEGQGGKDDEGTGGGGGGQSASSSSSLSDEISEAKLQQGMRGIQAIVGHEIGHSILHHTWALLLVTQLNFFLMFWTFGFVQGSPRLVTDFGYELPPPPPPPGGGSASPPPQPCAFLVVSCFMSVYSGLVMPFWSILMNAFTRQLEFAADAYSAKLGYAEELQAGLIAISKTNLGDLNPDWLVSMCESLHFLLPRACALCSRAYPCLPHGERGRAEHRERQRERREREALRTVCPLVCPPRAPDLAYMAAVTPRSLSLCCISYPGAHRRP